jgi:hypothetical protein
MIRSRHWYLQSILLACSAVLLGACSLAPQMDAPAGAAALPDQIDTSPDAVVPDPTATATATIAPTAVAVPPTSRGPDLVATDPESVALASGGPQLIEFFRFT